MKIEYSDFFEKIENSKKRTIIKEGLGNNKILFMQIRKTLPKGLPLKGFTSVTGVGFGNNGALIKPIYDNELYSNNKTAASLLKGYFNAKKEAVSIVTKVLKNSGYEITMPDFIGDNLMLKPLREEDVYDDNVKEVRYFRPNGKKITGIKDEEATILAALFGWIVFPEEEEEEEEKQEKEGSEDGAENDPVEVITGEKDEVLQQVETVEQPFDLKEEPAKDEPEKPSENVKTDTSEVLPVDKIDLNQDDTELEKDEIEQRIADLKNEFAETSETLSIISEDLINGRIPDNYQEADKINKLKEEFDHLIGELNFDNPEKIITIQDLEEEYKRIKEEQGKELYSKVLKVLNRYRKIYHVKGEDFPFFQELNKLSTTYENLIEENKVKKDDDWFLKLNEERHLFNHLNRAVELSQTKTYDDQELDEVLDHLEEECDANNFNFYKPLSNQINRGKLAFREDDQPEPPEKIPIISNKVKTELAEEKEPEIKTEHIAKDENLEVQTNIGKAIKSDSSFEEAVSEANDEEVLLKEEVSDIEARVINEEDETKEIRKEETKTSDELKEVETAKREEELPIPDESSEEIVEPKAAKKKILPDEDKNILELLKRDETELAYHLALCYEKQDKELLIPSWLLQNLFLSLNMRSSYAPIAQTVNANLELYDFKYGKTEECELINNLLFASILRPCLLAYNAGAEIILDGIHSGKLSQYSAVKKLFSDFMSQTGGELNFENLTYISDQKEVNISRQEFKDSLLIWLEKAQNSKYRNKPKHFHTMTFNGWVRKGGWLEVSLRSISSSENLKTIENLLKNDLDEDNWEKKFDKDLKSAIGKKQFRHGNSDADKWFKTQIDAIKELLGEGLNLYHEANFNSKNSYINQPNLTEFVSNVIQELKKINQTFSESNNSSYFKISADYVEKAINNVMGILTSQEQIGKPLQVNEIQNRPLLKLPFYDSLTDWSPVSYTTDLSGVIHDFINRPVKTIAEIVSDHLSSGNLEAINRMRDAYEISDEMIKNHLNEKEYEERVGYEIRKVNIEIEKGCAFGYISNDGRSDLIAKLEAIAIQHQSHHDGINFPLREFQLKSLLIEIENEKNIAIEHCKANIPKDIKKNEEEILNMYLIKGNVMAFIEALDQMTTGHFVEMEQETDDSLLLYKDYLINTERVNLTELQKSADRRFEYAGIDFKLFQNAQRNEIINLFKRWQSLREIWDFNNTASKDSVIVILEYLGFTSVKIESVQNYRKTFYLDFSCNPISGRNKTPIPQFGSNAQGEYRLMCSRTKLSVEDLVDEIDQLTPDSHRPLVVFYFDWINQKNRLEIARLSRTKRSRFLLLDEAMLTYLVGVKKNKFSAFIKLAAPLCHLKPYQTASSNLPEEMFYGRGPQIQKLKNMSGDYSCLIYGGRQLGKTVLQREVERIFDDPQNNHFSKYIDLRNNGIGLWNPIDKLPGVLIEALKSIPNLFPDKIPSNFGMPYIRSKLIDWFRINETARIILFLDEADKFLEQDSQQKWPHIHPLKGIMDDTKNRFKVILAGLHDVRRTIKIPNNPLAHLGSPICVGSMNEQSESIEAQLLIKLPLETLGFKFESEDLIYIILSHCNWYPSLIQIFCNQLLDILYTKRTVTDLPILITNKDISKALFASDKQIREKFKLTLNLDERYDLLANLIANETIERPEVQTNGISVNEITELTNITWQEGFDSINPKIDVNNLLEEMVDLGVLRIVSSGKFAVRTPNLIGLIGSPKEINDNIDKIRELPQEFRREFSRIIYERGGFERMSPFPASYYDKLFTQESKVLIIRGSKMGGIHKVEEFLESQKNDINTILPPFTEITKDSVSRFWEEVGRKRTPGKPDIVLFKSDVDYSIKDILLLNETIGRKERLQIVFLMEPKRMWEIFDGGEKPFDMMENQKIEIINIPQWRKDIAKEWIRVVCQTADISTVFEEIGNWHNLLYYYHEKIADSPEKWEELLKKHAASELNGNEGTMEAFGILNEIVIKVLNDLVEFDGLSSKHELIEYLESDFGLQKAINYVDFVMSLNLVGKDIKVNPIVQKVLSNG